MGDRTYFESLLETLETIHDVEEYLVQFLKMQQDLLGTEQELSACIRETVRHLERSFGESVTIRACSEQVGVTPNYLSHLFKKELGMSFTDYLTSLRINNAKLLLSATDHKIHYIARKSGMEDYKYFTKVFKKMYR
jgi:two-component system response regulator YesN